MFGFPRARVLQKKTVFKICMWPQGHISAFCRAAFFFHGTQRKEEEVQQLLSFVGVFKFPAGRWACCMANQLPHAFLNAIALPKMHEVQPF